MGLTQKLGTIPLAIQTDSSNNVGIGGAANASYKLDVIGTTRVSNALTISSTTNAALIAATNSTTGYTYLDLINNGASGKNYQIGVGGNAAAAGYANNLYFDLVGVGNIMTLTSGRNVGIGTSSPVEALTINGNILLDKPISSSAYSEIRARYLNDNNCQSSIRFYNPNNGFGGEMRFYTQPESNGAANTERMRITSDGLVGIGAVPNTSTTNGTLIVARDGAYPGDVNPANLMLCGKSSTGKRMTLGYDTTNNYGYLTAGELGVQWTSIYLQKTGGAVYAGSARIDNNSDARVKDNIQPISNALDKVLAMTGKKFHMIDEPENKIRLGFIAQELQGVVDELVIESDRTHKLPNGEVIENLLGLETWGSSWAALLVEAIKELNAKVTALENK